MNLALRLFFSPDTQAESGEEFPYPAARDESDTRRRSFLIAFLLVSQWDHQVLVGDVVVKTQVLDGGFEVEADINGDGIINVLDIVTLINLILL